MWAIEISLWQQESTNKKTKCEKQTNKTIKQKKLTTMIYISKNDLLFQKLKNDLDVMKLAISTISNHEMAAFPHSQNDPPETYHWQNITAI